MECFINVLNRKMWFCKSLRFVTDIIANILRYITYFWSIYCKTEISTFLGGIWSRPSGNTAPQMPKQNPTLPFSYETTSGPRRWRACCRGRCPRWWPRRRPPACRTRGPRPPGCWSRPGSSRFGMVKCVLAWTSQLEFKINSRKSLLWVVLPLVNRLTD